MEPPSSPCSTITAPPDCHETSRRLAKLIAEAMTCRFALLHYDSASGSMVEWCWPADGDGERVPLSSLEKYRDEHELRYPCCLCADGGGRKAYVEAAVYPWWNEVDKNTDWIVRCASDGCGYRVTIGIYFRISTAASLMDDKENPVLPIKLEWTRREQTELLRRLDSSEGYGISARKFRVLFKRCKKCMRIVLRSAINRHICLEGVQKDRCNRFLHRNACMLRCLTRSH
ncbi:hypothetical protein P692DRAFT_20711473 [Suillus brevipes Sb2]|nr:hypothetical protein P692DRAFT_20711473 [Suillus brevipes Sb2]